MNSVSGQDDTVTLREAVVAWLQGVPDTDESALTLRESVVFWLQNLSVSAGPGPSVFMTGSVWSGGPLYRSSGDAPAPVPVGPTLREAVVSFLRSAATP